MAKINPSKNGGIVSTKTPPGTDLPEHLRSRKPMGLETMKDYIILPKIKMIQKSASKELLDVYKTGTLVILPTKTLLRPILTKQGGQSAEAGEAFSFVPLFFFPSWGQLNDIKKKGTEPTYLKYTTNVKDPLVALCRNPETREQVHPKDPACKIKNVEMLNFVVFLEDVEGFKEQPVIMTFMRGEHRTGSDFAARIRMTGADLFARRWVGYSKYRPGKGQGDWYGIEVIRWEDGLQLDPKIAKRASDQGVGPWMGSDEIGPLEQVHLSLVKQFEAQGIKPVEDEDDLAEAAAPSTAAASKY